MLRKIFILIVFSFFILQGDMIAQDAENVLNKVEENFSSLEKASYDFNLSIEIPEQSAINQKGSLIKSSEKYFITIGDRWIKSDGVSQWIYDPEMNEVQIYNAGKGNALPISPESMTSLYKNGDFNYDITGVGDVDGKSAIFIEFKPLDRMSEYVKMRFAINEDNYSPIYFKVFSRDGTRYTLQIESINKSPQIPTGVFTFTKEQYPEVGIEDLRL